ncbi:hypothetical protein [Alteromonas sp. a30]|uniref:hypothetical protein n=1 Tax=Alteromonas sp. a30 TaxID=2730917 RepID=UPI002280D550|nr:hypothetical protein [Alteromonas sp. a30]MCY7297251.1 hypothetical protein [Alteromonas sp. a30]
MSYLSLPRLHFAGAFFANPSNLNNTVVNFSKAQENESLFYETGTYNNPKGVGQFFFQDCEITQCFNDDGQENVSDPFLSAKVITPSPLTPIFYQGKDDSGKPVTKSRIMAKIADLDPDMQFRGELYGVYISITNKEGYGIEGYMNVPQLRDLFFGRGAGGDQGMQIACGTWHQRFYVIKWHLAADDTTSTLALLKKDSTANQTQANKDAGYQGELDIKLSTDMFQCDPQQQTVVGNRYCFGRMMATLGPIQPNMPMQIVPGRRLYSGISFDCSNLQAAKANNIVTREQAEQTAKDVVPAALATLNSSAGVTNSDALWNNTDARVVKDKNGKSFLLIDMGTTTPLKDPSNGAFDLGQNMRIGYLDEQDNFTAFASQGYQNNGSLMSVSAQLTDYIDLPEAAQVRSSVFLKNAGVVQIALTDDEATAIQTKRLNIQLSNGSVLRENPDGYYINFDLASRRMSPNQSTEDTLTGFRFGEPLTEIATQSDSDTNEDTILLEQNVTSLSYGAVLGAYASTSKTEFSRLSSFINSTAIDNKPGQFAMTLKTGDSAPFDTKPQDNEKNNWLRQPLDSLICYVNVTSKHNLIGENPAVPNAPFCPAVSVLFWQNQHVTADTPTWDNNISPILSIYSQLYPGMTSRMDIGDEATVKANATAFKVRFNEPTDDPAFMPVVRDMSPETIDMMTRWLDMQIDASSNSQGAV